MAGADQRATVTAAAQAHHVDPNVLWGIYGAESSWGKASNWFGLVAVPRTGSFAGDANASASTMERLLSTHHGDYEQALRAYSGGGYGLAHVNLLVRESPGGRIPVPSSSGPKGATPPVAAAAPTVSGGDRGLFQDSQRSGALKALLWVVLVLGGTALSGIGASRAFGIHKPKLPVPA